ncbi:hypothetical protein Nm8I071_23370 [Nonomuraea sp. TT08I-71]|nr:hypothetical protein Nm8I071_23370 [Nonomuraea sp. TT08I-71]
MVRELPRPARRATWPPESGYPQAPPYRVRASSATALAQVINVQDGSGDERAVEASAGVEGRVPAEEVAGRARRDTASGRMAVDARAG